MAPIEHAAMIVVLLREWTTNTTVEPAVLHARALGPPRSPRCWCRVGKPRLGFIVLESSTDERAEGVERDGGET